MIVRTWSGATRAEDAARYEAILRKTGLRAYRETPGNRGAWILRRREGPHEEFLVISLWESMHAIQAFAGPRPQRAVFYPEDERYLVRADRMARHWRVGAGASPPVARRDFLLSGA